jgi:hypothetical protein
VNYQYQRNGTKSLENDSEKEFIMTAAKVSTISILEILDNLPDYRQYAVTGKSEEIEHRLRTCLAQTLRELGNQLLFWSAKNETRLGCQKQEILEILADEMAENIKMLNRRGSIKISGDFAGTAIELRELDSQLVMLLEHMSEATKHLISGRITVFATFTQDMSIFLDSFGELLEERNRLIGMGWESEIRRGLYCGI